MVCRTSHIKTSSLKICIEMTFALYSSQMACAHHARICNNMWWLSFCLFKNSNLSEDVINMHFNLSLMLEEELEEYAKLKSLKTRLCAYTEFLLWNTAICLKCKYQILHRFRQTLMLKQKWNLTNDLSSMCHNHHTLKYYGWHDYRFINIVHYYLDWVIFNLYNIANFHSLFM